MARIACVIPGCEQLASGRYLCRHHAYKARRDGTYDSYPSMTPTPAQNIERRTSRMPNGCLEWTGALSTSGYGSLAANGKHASAHRVAWEMANGPIPDGLYVLHRCDNRKCCDPEHLFLGTNTENMRDMTAKGRHFMQKQTYCPQGHEYLPANTYITPEGHRSCRSCRKARYAIWQRDHRKSYRARKRAESK